MQIENFKRHIQAHTWELHHCVTKASDRTQDLFVNHSGPKPREAK